MNIIKNVLNLDFDCDSCRLFTVTKWILHYNSEMAQVLELDTSYIRILNASQEAFQIITAALDSDPYFYSYALPTFTFSSSLITGKLYFGDCIADAFHICHLFRTLTTTKALADLYVSIVDSDGFYLIFDAAHLIPEKWTPESTADRLYIHRGKVVMVPEECPSDMVTEALEVPSEWMQICQKRFGRVDDEKVITSVGVEAWMGVLMRIDKRIISQAVMAPPAKKIDVPAGFARKSVETSLVWTRSLYLNGLRSSSNVDRGDMSAFVSKAFLNLYASNAPLVHVTLRKAGIDNTQMQLIEAGNHAEFKFTNDELMKETDQSWLEISEQQLNDLMPNVHTDRDALIESDDEEDQLGKQEFVAWSRDVLTKLDDFAQQESDYQGVDTLQQDDTDVEFDVQEYLKTLERVLNPDAGVGEAIAAMDAQLGELMKQRGDVTETQQVESLLESARAQDGSSGPFTTIAGSLGLEF